ncbi:hypothetical protein [Streptomyces sp. NRRL S-1824]|uniref:hypothetical protein n=1 Tax=Streptomyces sp. NRRL S-1824 TaxID=1463889 RepID=UPI000AC253BF|nr:hypothetical protein [Streptomyces sp. NRRL S-1824]
MPPRPATKAATAPVSAALGVDSSAQSTKAAIVDAPGRYGRESSRDPVARATTRHF